MLFSAETLPTGLEERTARDEEADTAGSCRLPMLPVQHTNLQSERQARDESSIRMPVAIQ